MTPDNATISYATLERLARDLCESHGEDKGRYDRKGCKRAYWRKKAMVFHAQITTTPALAALYRACGWHV